MRSWYVYILRCRDGTLYTGVAIDLPRRLDAHRRGVAAKYTRGRRPVKLAYFTIAHELTHLLQARGFVPTGERACDLHALARSPLVIDSLPGYLKLPRGLRGRREVEPSLASALHRLAREALARRGAGDRRYLSGFERDLAKAYEVPPWHRRVRRALAGAVATLRLELDL